MAHAHCMLDTLSFSTATMVAGTCLNVTFVRTITSLIYINKVEIV